MLIFVPPLIKKKKKEVVMILLLLAEALLSREHMLPEAEVNRHHSAMATTEAHIQLSRMGGGVVSTAAR